jgi:hypothetical protein
MAQQNRKTKGTKNYQRLIEMYNNLQNFTDDALESRRKWFIQEAIQHYDMVEFGIIYFGELSIDLESIYYDSNENRIMLHISCKEMEGDIYFSSLQEKMQKKVTDLMFDEMKHIEEGPTMFSMMIDGANILCRNVFIKELNSMVKVTTEEDFSAHIEEGSSDDKKFYCYVPTEKFFKLNDVEFEDYVNNNF